MKNKPKDIPYCGVRKEKILNAEPTVGTLALRHLYRFITRRYKIHLLKDVEKLPPPWTKDKILQNFRFTNIRREHDRETKWLIEHIASNPELSYKNKLLNVVLFRVFNKSQTMELIGAPIKFNKGYEPEDYRKIFQRFEKENPKIALFTGAFNTGGIKGALGRATGEPYMPMRVMKYMEEYIETLAHKISMCSYPTQIIETLCKYQGLSSFLAYQVFVDFTYIEEFPYSENEFVVAGPGCKRGLDELFIKKDGLNYEELIFWLRDNLDSLFKNHEGLKPRLTSKEIFCDLPEYDRCFNVMSLENCFCEFSKYIRAVNGTGRPRQRYTLRAK